MTEDVTPTIISDGLPSDVPQPSTQETSPPVVEQSPQVQKSPRQEGTEQVDFNKLPADIRPEFEKRFNNLYYQVKKHQKERDGEVQYYRALETKLDNFINSTNEGKVQEKIELMAEKAKALFADKKFDEAVELTRKVAEMSAQAATTTAQAKQESTQPDAFTSEEEKYLADFITTTPWAQFNSPHHNKTKDILSQLLATKMSMKDAVDTTKSIMSGLVDNIPTNGQQSPTPIPAVQSQHPVVQAVLGQNLSMPGVVDKNPMLDEIQMAHARKMFPRLKATDAYAKYQRGLND